MKLDEFVHETLRSISIGVTRAKLEVGDLTAIAPGKLNGECRTTETEVAFDIALSATSDSSSVHSGGGKVAASLKVLAVDVSVGGNAGLENASNTKDSKVSRVTFTIPMLLNAGNVAEHGPTLRENEKMAERLKQLEEDE